MEYSGSERFCRLHPTIKFSRHSLTLHLVGTTLSESFTAILHSLIALGRPTTLSVLVQIVRVFQMRLQGMNIRLLERENTVTDVVVCVAGQLTPITVPG